MATKSTSPKVATKAAKLLSTKTAGVGSKSVAGSAVSQAGTKKVTSRKEAATASQVLRDGRTSASAKSAAGSVLSQRPAAKKAPAKKAVGSAIGSGTSSGGPRKAAK